MSQVAKQLNVSNTCANDARVAGIFENIDDELKILLKSNHIFPKPLMICGGGTSSRCAADNHWTLDLRKNYDFFEFNRQTNEAIIGAGISMGKFVKELKKYKRSFPIGLSGSTGIGYILTGGISPLSRSNGLAVDQILEIEGVWANGENFTIAKPTNNSLKKIHLIWQALSGAAPFFAIITKLKVKTQPIQPLIIWEGSLTPKQLEIFIKESEDWSIHSSFHWIWGDIIKVLAVFKEKEKDSIRDLKKLNQFFDSKINLNINKIDGIDKLPIFKPYFYKPQESLFHSEVIGLLSNSWGDDCNEILSIIENSIESRPHIGCCIASQQLGGKVRIESYKNTSFIHREAMWKPWITASWPANDKQCRELSLEWLETTWTKLEPFCPGIHLAQLHQHLPWNKKESFLAFGDLLPALKGLKQNLDPNGLFPSFS